MAVLKWSDDEEMIARVNACPFGLGSSIFSRNVRRAEGIASRVRSGARGQGTGSDVDGLED